MLVGVDDMDIFKGIELKLQAFERLLEMHPEWHGKLALVQVGVMRTRPLNDLGIQDSCLQPQETSASQDTARHHRLSQKRITSFRTAGHGAPETTKRVLCSS